MAWLSLAELMCSMCSIMLCSPSQIWPSFTSQGGLVGLVAGIVVTVVGGIVVVVLVSGIVVPSVPMVVVPSVPAVVLGIMVVPMVVSGMGGQGHSEKEGELGPQMQSGHSSTKSQLGEFFIGRQERTLERQEGHKKRNVSETRRTFK